MGVSIKRRLAIVAVACSALLSTGCEIFGAGEPDRRGELPLAAAGRACELLDYDVVETQLGTRFDTVGGADKDGTYTCALTQAGSEYPDLTLAVTATAADEVIFTATVTPSSSTAVKGLGRIAYRVDIAPSGSSGPGVEVGWLSAHERLLIVRYTFPPGTPAQQVDDFPPRLIGLSQQIEARLAAPGAA